MECVFAGGTADATFDNYCHEEEFDKLWPANKTDHLCHVMHAINVPMSIGVTTSWCANTKAKRRRLMITTREQSPLLSST